MLRVPKPGESDERADIVHTLADHLAAGTTISTLIAVAFPGNSRIEFQTLPTNLTNVLDQAAWVVDTCLASRWRLTPSLLESLLDRLVNIAGRGEFLHILERVRRKEDPNPDPFLSPWLLRDEPFVNRAGLRTAVRSLFEDSSRPILRVNGPEKSGKTYTMQYLNYVSVTTRQDVHVVPVVLTPGTGPSFELSDLTDEMTITMQTKPFSDLETAAARRRWLILWAHRNPGLWIFVLDGFGATDSQGQLEIKKDVHEFILQLAQHIGNPEIGRKLRLVLLHFPMPLLGNWRAMTLDDSAGGFTTADLIACLHEFNLKMQAMGQTGKMIKLADIPIVANNILNNANATTAPMVSVYNELWTLRHG